MKVLGIGNSLVDMLCRLPNDDVIEKHDLPKGGMKLIDKDLALQISADIEHLPCQFVSGGSAANTICGIARLGEIETAFLGKIGNDAVGEHFKGDLAADGVAQHLLISSLPTGRCISLISPDGERTMCTCLGATGELRKEDIADAPFKGVDLCHIGGYLVQEHDMIEEVMRKAKAAGAKISLDLASYNVVNNDFDFMHHLVRTYVDICFANEEESAAYTKLGNLEEAVEALAEDTDLAVAKCGAAGVWTKEKDAPALFTPSLKGRKCIDTTGAGDLFASGFIHGLLTSNYNVSLAAKYGTIVGGNIIEHIGTRMDTAVWDSIKTQFKQCDND